MSSKPKGELGKIEGTQRAQEKYEYHIKNLENDKTSLSKRLNIVLMELDKITTEKADYDRQMAEQLKISSELEEKITKNENLSKVLNKNLQDDLKYEKDLNDKLREEISKYETQKSQLFVQLREQQAMAEQFDREVRTLEESIGQKESDIGNLVELHEKTKHQLMELEQETETLKNRLDVQGADIEQLAAEIQKVEEERNELIQRMNDLTDKYEAYVGTMTRERDDLAKTTKKHIKLLTAKILAEKMCLLLNKQYSTSMNKITYKLHSDSLKQHMTERIAIILNRVATRKVKEAFQHWCCSLLNWPQERMRREQLLDHIVRDKSKRMAFAAWLRTSRAAKEATRGTTTAATKLWHALESVGQGAVQSAFLRIKQQWVDDTKRRLQLNRVLVQKHTKSMRLAFESWKVGTKKVRQRLVFEYLANKMAESQLTQTTFHRFKDAVRQNRIDNQVALYRGFRYWKNAKRKQDQISKAAIICLKVEDHSNTRMKRRIFHALQQNRMESKLAKLSNQLQQTKESHAELNNKLAATRQEHEAKNKTLALKRVAAHLANRVYPYLSKWRRYCKYKKQGLEKLKVLIYTVYRNKLTSAVDNWKKSVKRLALGQAAETLAEANEKIQKLEVEQHDMKRLKEKNEADIAERGFNKLKQNFYVINKLYARRAFRKWLKNSMKIKDCSLHMVKMCKRLASINAWLAFKRYRGQVKEIRQAELWERRVKFLNDKIRDNNLRRKIAKWKKYVERIKKAKAAVQKAISRFTLCQNKWAFQEWRKTIRKERLEEKKMERIELQKEEKDLKRQNEDITDECAKLAKQKKEDLERVKAKAMSILWNNAVRQKTLDRQNAFQLWRSRTAEDKRKKRRTKKVLTENFLAGARIAFDKWLKIVRLQQVQNMRKNLEEQKIKLKIGKNKSKVDLSQAEGEKGESEKLLERAKKSAAKTHEIAARVIAHLINKRDKNVYLPIHQAVLRQWKAVAEREKQLSDRLMLLAKRHIFEHVFIKIKNASLDKKEQDNKAKAVERIKRLSKKSLLKDGFDKWKMFIYSETRESYKENWENKQNDIKGVESKIEALNERLYNNGEAIINRRKKERLMFNLSNSGSLSRFMKDKAEAYTKNHKYIRLKYAVQKWKCRTMATQKIKLKFAKATNLADKKLMRKCFEAYRMLVRSQRSLPKALNRIADNFGINNKIRGLFIIKSYAASHQQHNDNLKENGVAKFGTVAERIFRSRIISCLGILGAHSRVYRGRSTKLSRAIVTLYLRRLRAAFLKLNEKKEQVILRNTVELEGKPARTLEKLNEEISLMEDTLRKEGYEDANMERCARRMEEDKTDLVKKAISRWLAYKNEKTDVIMAVDKWKKYTKEQLERKTKLNKLCNFFENRPLHKGFTRWKTYINKIKDSYKGASKEELVYECMGRGREKAAMEDEVAYKRQAAAKAEEEAKILAEKHKTSMKFAFLYAQKINNGAKEKAFQRWRERIGNNKISALRQQLDELSAQMNDLISSNDELEEKNIGLAQENEQLKQLSLESVDIAKSMKDLNKQKEQLSVDLADRAATIRKLLEDNKTLNEKLVLAQKEAAKGFGAYPK